LTGHCTATNRGGSQAPRLPFQAARRVSSTLAGFDFTRLQGAVFGPRRRRSVALGTAGGRAGLPNAALDPGILPEPAIESCAATHARPVRKPMFGLSLDGPHGPRSTLRARAVIGNSDAPDRVFNRRPFLTSKSGCHNLWTSCRLSTITTAIPRIRGPGGMCAAELGSHQAIARSAITRSGPLTKNVQRAFCLCSIASD
jgi:hypothetical protein